MTDPATVHCEKLGPIRLRIVIDPEPCNPRTDWHSAATMACWHRRYRLGDDDGPARLRDAVRASRARRSLGHVALDNPAELAAALAQCSDIIWLPLYLYDHSGITMSTSCTYPFNDRWDAGQVGFVFMTRAQVLAELGPIGARRLTPTLRARAEALMRDEVAGYDQYLTGEVFGYIVEDDSGEHLDSCWGFFDRLHCVEDGRASARYLANEHAIRDRAILATTLEAARPDTSADTLPFGQ